MTSCSVAWTIRRMDLPFPKLEKSVRGTSSGVGGNQELSFKHTKCKMPFRYVSGDTELDSQIYGSRVRPMLELHVGEL